MKTAEQSNPELKVFHISKMNKNPRLYKYYWWVVAKSDLPAGFQNIDFSYSPVGPSNIPMVSWIAVESKEQDRALGLHITMNFEPICLFDALGCMAVFESNNQPFVAIRKEMPRLGSLFNPKHEKWKNREFASAFDEDSDPIVDGHK